jgi:hypothetical protein
MWFKSYKLSINVEYLNTNNISNKTNWMPMSLWWEITGSTQYPYLRISRCVIVVYSHVRNDWIHTVPVSKN